MIELDVKVLRPLYMSYQTDGKREGSHPVKTAYASPETVDIIFKYRWKPEMMNIMAQSAAALDVKQFTERHIDVYSSTDSHSQSKEHMCEAYIHFALSMIKE